MYYCIRPEKVNAEFSLCSDNLEAKSGTRDWSESRKRRVTRVRFPRRKSRAQTGGKWNWIIAGTIRKLGITLSEWKFHAGNGQGSQPWSRGRRKDGGAYLLRISLRAISLWVILQKRGAAETCVEWMSHERTHDWHTLSSLAWHSVASRNCSWWQLRGVVSFESMHD